MAFVAIGKGSCCENAVMHAEIFAFQFVVQSKVYL